jgi:hypothetical protein
MMAKKFLGDTDLVYLVSNILIRSAIVKNKKIPRQKPPGDFRNC